MPRKTNIQLEQRIYSLSLFLIIFTSILATNHILSISSDPKIIDEKRYLEEDANRVNAIVYSPRDTLIEIAKKSWGFFKEMRDDGFPYGVWTPSSYSGDYIDENYWEAGLYLQAIVAAEDLDLISYSEATSRINEVIRKYSNGNMLVSPFVVQALLLAKERYFELSEPIDVVFSEYVNWTEVKGEVEKTVWDKSTELELTIRFLISKNVIRGDFLSTRNSYSHNGTITNYNGDAYEQFFSSFFLTPSAQTEEYIANFTLMEISYAQQRGSWVIGVGETIDPDGIYRDHGIWSPGSDNPSIFSPYITLMLLAHDQLSPELWSSANFIRQNLLEKGVRSAYNSTSHSWSDYAVCFEQAIALICIDSILNDFPLRLT